MKKLLTGFSLIVLCYMLIFTGFDGATHQYRSMGIDLIMAAFFVGFLLLLLMDTLRDYRRDVKKELADEASEKSSEIFKVATDHLAKSMAGPVKQEDQRDEHADIVMKLIEEVGGPGELKPKSIAAIEQKFHEQTGKYVSIKVAMGGIHVEIKDEPIKAKRGRKSSALAATKRATQAKDSAAISKSQQRRIAATKATDKEQKTE